jgi:hypothetical protein
MTKNDVIRLLGDMLRSPDDHKIVVQPEKNHELIFSSTAELAINGVFVVGSKPHMRISVLGHEVSIHFGAQDTYVWLMQDTCIEPAASHACACSFADWLWEKQRY